MQLSFVGDASAHINLTWAGNHRSNRYEVDGSEGSLSLHDGRLRLDAGGRTGEWPAEDLASGGHAHAHWTDALHADLLTRIDESDPMPGPWSMAIHVADVINAAGISAESGGCAVQLLPAQEAAWPG
jgi:hypothetical protein